MTDIFDRAAQVLEKERQLLEHDPALFGPLEAPVDALAPVEIDHADLLTANTSFQPPPLPAGTRHRRLKSAVLRLLSVYTAGQIGFNAAVVRILNAWNARLSTLADDVTDRVHTVQERTNTHLWLVEQRRNRWESNFTQELKLLEDRVGELEAALLALQAQLRERRET